MVWTFFPQPRGEKLQAGMGERSWTSWGRKRAVVTVTSF